MGSSKQPDQMFSFTHCGNGGELYENYTKKGIHFGLRKRIKRQLLLDLNYLV